MRGFVLYIGSTYVGVIILNVLSLFDGISCGKVALDRVGIPVEAYYASEIEKYAIDICMNNHPDVIQIGDVTTLDFSVFKGKIDILMGGSPCMGFSSAGKRLNFDDPRSRLFIYYVQALRVIKPKYFLLENVCMKKEWENVITDMIGVEPILINSALVSAQNRNRLYWTNIPGVTQPEDKNIKLKDILEENYWPFNDKKLLLRKASIIGRRLNEDGHRDDYNKSIPITQCLEVRATNTDKSNCITTVDKDNVLTPMPIGRHPNAFELPFRYYTTTEYCRLQTLPDDYVRCVPNSAARKAIGNAWTVDVIAHILSHIPEVDYGL